MFYLPPVDYNLADLFEHAVDVFGDREYIVANGQRRTYSEMDARANQLAHHLAAQGVGAGDHVGIYAYNRVEWVETLWAVFKLRATWININYRYVEEELRYLFASSDVVAMVVDRQFADRVVACRESLPLLRHVLVVDDGRLPGAGGVEVAGAAEVEHLEQLDYEVALTGQSHERDFGPRSGDDRYILFTGGTTGLPKGVVWRHEDVLYALGGGIDPLTNIRISDPQALARKGLANGFQITFLPIAPLMHGATQWGVMGQSFQGNRVVLVDRFDAEAVWGLVGELGVNALMFTGDAMARPLIEEYEQRLSDGEPYDTSSLISLSSTAAVFSPDVKEAFFRHFPNVIMTDAIGSSESGANGIVVLKPGQTAMRGGPTVTAVRDSVVLGADLRPMEPGTGEIGRLARSGNVPLGYYKDPAKSAEVFIDVEATRYVMTGDLALLEADGTISLLGRGSVSINTGGEKVFPEEVEAAVKSHPDVYDATIVGVPDERWGQRVAAVVEPRPGAAPDLESIQAYCRTRVAGYKVPRELHLVDRLVRSPAGKPDYRWALTVALGDADVPEAAAPSAADLTPPAGASETSSSSPAPTPEESR
ncbi:MAG: acyl-CoA synthetase [Acidimicrobiales bacterium]|jgi:acyl-CoA synthetase (AMP-forming)/AMP-acid ligase II